MDATILTTLHSVLSLILRNDRGRSALLGFEGVVRQRSRGRNGDVGDDGTRQSGWSIWMRCTSTEDFIIGEIIVVSVVITCSKYLAMDYSGDGATRLDYMASRVPQGASFSRSVVAGSGHACTGEGVQNPRSLLFSTF